MTGRTVRIAKGLKAHFCCEEHTHRLRVEWDPATPVNPSQQVASRYRIARSASLQDYAEKTGVRIVVIDAIGH